MTLGKVAIVGSGVAGATIADILLGNDAASKIVMFEAGNEVVMRDHRKWLDYITTGSLPYYWNEDDVTDASGTENFWVKGGRLMAVGGSTLHWGGWCPRFKPEDFFLKSNTERGLDWPFTYEDLTPYYVKAEQRLRVTGDGSRDDPPRHNEPYPVPKMPLAKKDGLIVNALENLGISSYGNLPIARSTSCQTVGSCAYCPVGGRYDASMDIQSNFETFELRSKSPVAEIIMDSKKKAYGLRYVDMNTGEHQQEEFDRIFVCGGSMESAKLLLSSRSRFWHSGLGNDTGHVGQHLSAHSLLRVTGQMPGNASFLQQELDFPTLECRHFDVPENQYKGKFYFVHDGRIGHYNITKKLLAGTMPAQIDEERASGTGFGLAGFMEEFAAPGSRIELASGKNRFGLPKTNIVYTTSDITKSAKLEWLEKMEKILRVAGVDRDFRIKNGNPRADHTVSLCRMSDSASEGVVDQNCKIHDCDNVHVVSNAVFPNLTAVNPTLTLVAVAIKVAENLSR
ncbi:MAG: GMC family oxidoreductase [Pseudomonadota bacterium]